MTTAHRPTLAPAKGGGTQEIDQGGYFTGGKSYQFSVRDIPSETRLKYRKPGQKTQEEISKKDLLAELEEKERKHFEQKQQQDSAGDSGAASLSHVQIEDKGCGHHQQRQLTNRAGTELKPEEYEQLHKYDDADADFGEESEVEDDSNDSEDDEDEDDTAELMRELEKIKKEREEEKERREKEDEELQRKEQEAAAVKGNPLMNLEGGTSGSSAVVKRRWNDDVVFKNQARDEPKQKRRFVNDTIRNDFHRNFLNKYFY
eukprot:gb/GECG01010734.1/.p1 GENE.gb/GECG01010734.1/~~gb/GECG01010734.1/.p1  ORF type:complete len:259 (+),score=70.78 gb/GECG01010734.1/:1-777(+)